MFSDRSVWKQGIRKRPTSKTRKYRGHSDEIPTNQPRLTCQPLGIADPYVNPAVVTKTETQATMQVGTRSRSKRSIAQINPPQFEKAKKPKYDEQQKRYVNRIPQKKATARSQAKKAQSQRDKKANQRKQKAILATDVQGIQIRFDTNLKDQERAADNGTVCNPNKTFSSENDIGWGLR